MPSTRNNNRAIDHILVTEGILPHIRSVGLVPKEIGFSTSDHQAIFLDLKSKLKTMQEEADLIRETHHDTIYEKAAELHHKDKMTIVKEMKEREKQSRIYQKISYVLAPHRFQAIARLGIPKGMMQATTKAIWDYLQEKERTKDTIEWEYTEDDEDIKFRLKEWNILHFNQSIETPLAEEKWEKLLTPDQMLDKDISKTIQTAIDSDPNLHPASICLLQEMKRKVSKPMPIEKTTVSLEEFRGFFRHTPEDRSSSPSGLHLGHYKSAAFSEEFSAILWNIATIALENQYALIRWHRSATVLLEKSAGNPFIHKYRTIHLIESDLNFIMRKVWG